MTQGAPPSFVQSFQENQQLSILGHYWLQGAIHTVEPMLEKIMVSWLRLRPHDQPSAGFVRNRAVEFMRVSPCMPPLTHICQVSHLSAKFQPKIIPSRSSPSYPHLQLIPSLCSSPSYPISSYPCSYPHSSPSTTAIPTALPSSCELLRFHDLRQLGAGDPQRQPRLLALQGLGQLSCTVALAGLDDPRRLGGSIGSIQSQILGEAPLF